MAEWRKKLQQHKPLVWAALAALGVLAAAVLVWLACVRPNAAKGMAEKISDDYSASTLLEDGVTASQVFSYDNALLAVSLEFEISGAQPAGELELVVTDADTGEELARSTGVLEYLVPGQYTALGLDREIPAVQGRRYRVSVTPHYTGGGRVAIGHSAGVSLWSEQMQLGDTTVDGTMAMMVTCRRIGGYLSRFFLLVGAGAALLVFLGVWLALGQKLALHRLAFVLVLGFGLLYSLVLPPYAAPDEKYHINQSFTLACQWANRFSTDDWVMGHVPTTSSFRRVTDVDPLLQDENTTVFTWQQFTENLFTTTGEDFDSHMELNELQVDQNPLLYLASAAAVFVGYLLHLGFAPTLALGRLANLLLFAALAAFAIKRTPYGKRLFLAAALLPMTLHLAASFSRDAPLLGLCFAFTALVLDAAFGPAAGQPLRPRQWLPLVVCGVLLAPGKVVYLPLALLFLLVPARALGKAPRAKKAAYAAACVVLALVLNSATLTGSLGSAAAADSETAAAEIAETAEIADETALPTSHTKPPTENRDYWAGIVYVSTPETFVRRLFYFAEGDIAPTQSEVDFWCQALAEGDVTPAALGQSFFLSPAKLGDSAMDAEAFVSGVSMSFMDQDIVEIGLTDYVTLYEEQGPENCYKAMMTMPGFENFLADINLTLGEMDDRIPLDRETLAAEIQAARATRATQSVADEADRITYTPGYILTHLPQTVLLLVRSAVQNGDHYLRAVVGGSLSYYTLDLAWGWVVLLYALLALAALPAQNAPALVGRGRVWGALAALACCALVVGGCIVWTPTYYETIYGLQGRYFLPVLPLLALTCLPRRLAAVKDEATAAAHLTVALCLVQAGVLMNIMLAVIAR